MNHKEMIGFEVRTLNNLIVRRMVADAEKYGIDEISVMHSWIIGFIMHNSDKDIYQKDIEAEFSLAKSSVTCILKLMEKNGYITRETVPFDARLKKLVPTPEGIKMNERTKKNIDLMETDLVKNLTKEEIDVFFRASHKMKNYLESYESVKEK